MRIITCFLLLLVCKITSAQLNEDFSGSLSSNWVGSNLSKDFVINNGMLQSQSTVANSNFYLSIENKLSVNCIWEFWVNLKFNTSGANYVDIYLVSDKQDLKSTSINGYFIRIGGTNDEISLFKRSGMLASAVKIVDGEDGITNSTNTILKIKVVRNANGDFEIFRDKTGTGLNYVFEGGVNDKTFVHTAFFGIYIQQSTVSFHQKHFFDDFSVREIQLDVEPPTLQKVRVIDSLTIEIEFSEPLKISSTANTLNFKFGSVVPDFRIEPTFAPHIFNLIFDVSPATGSYLLKIKDVEDLAGNIQSNEIITSFFYVRPYVPRKGEFFINELMVDPTPVVGLPNAEYVELWNKSDHYILLQNWKLQTQSAEMKFGVDTILPQSFVIITSTANKPLFNHIETKIISPTTWAALRNENGILRLINSNSEIVDEVFYDLNTYKDARKKDGGYSLELIDPDNKCVGRQNWMASANEAGGTPGGMNSVYKTQLKETEPELISVKLKDERIIELIFSNSIDSLLLSRPANYVINNGIGVPESVKIIGYEFRHVELTLREPPRIGLEHLLTMVELRNCGGVLINPEKNSGKILRTKRIEAGDIIINEILFDPKPGGADFLELMNTTDHILNLTGLTIANADQQGKPSVKRLITTEPLYIEPKEYIVLTSNVEAQHVYYRISNPNALKTFNLPAFALEKGKVFVLNDQEIIDQFEYHQNMHFPLVSNYKGVSLERVSDKVSANSIGNFVSASSRAGYATPGYKNAASGENLLNFFKANKPVFVPLSANSEESSLVISYGFLQRGNIGTLKIFSDKGRLVKTVFNNHLLGKTGEIIWQGNADDGRVVPQGIYLLVLDVFDLAGKRFKMRATVVVAEGR